MLNLFLRRKNEKFAALGLMLISALAVDNPIANLLKEYENKCSAGTRWSAA